MITIGIDIGGTFTDIVAVSRTSGQINRAKVLTTPSAPEDGFLQALAQLDVPLADVGSIMHGTTLVTNLVIERKGATVGLLTTAGFRDVLEIGRSYRREQYNLQWDKPAPLVPRRRRLEISERVLADGTIEKAPELSKVEAAVQALLAEGVDAIAVCFFNSYIDSSNERLVGEVVRRLAPHVALSLSCDVDPRIREYERVSTTVLNSYAMPRLNNYMQRLETAVPPDTHINYMQSGGGVVPGRLAGDYPIHLLFSGPAAGVLAAQAVAQTRSIDAICTLDMGGTSCDVCLVRNGEPAMKDLVEPEWGIPARTPTVDVRAVGAGGGSVIWVDAGGALRVGPQSMGSDPGPAAYGRGGQATVTDANLLLGLLNADGLLGGRLPLDAEAARRALLGPAEKLGVSPEEVAMGAFRIVNANMAQAIREITVAVGVDPRDFTLLPFGGAGGQHAFEVASEMGIPRVLFPRNASAFSAFGLLTADLKHSAATTLMRSIEATSPSEVEAVLLSLEREATDSLGADQLDGLKTSSSYAADIRYIGQSHEIPVPLDINRLDLEETSRDFHKLHERTYGVRSDNPIEIVDLRVTVTGTTAHVAIPEYVPSAVLQQETGHRRTAFSSNPVPVFSRDTLPIGWQHDGPCLIDEVDSVIFAPTGVAEIDRFGSILVEL